MGTVPGGCPCTWEGQLNPVGVGGMGKVWGDGPKTQWRALVKDIRSELAEGARQLEGPF